ncbi:MAG: metallophosphoesterase [Flammeovirgaceae bacterium]
MNKLVALPKMAIVPILVLVMLGIDFYVFQAIRTLLRHRNVLFRRLIYGLYWSVTLTLLIGLFIFYFADETRVGDTLRTIIMVSIFMTYFSKLFTLAFVFIDDTVRLIKWMYRKAFPVKKVKVENGISRSQFLAKAGLALAAMPVFAVSYGVVAGAHDYRVRRRRIYLPHLPKSFDGLKIAQISDIHSGSFFNKTAVRRGVKMLMDEAADLVFFTGDLVNDQASEVQEYVDIFGKINAPLGVFSVLGNHDYGDYIVWESEEAKKQNLAKLKQAHAAMGWRLLLNEHEILEKDGEELAIIGVENWGAGGFSKYGDLQKATAGMPHTPVKLLLSHDPSHWEYEVKDTDIDITFAGHTHGMQFGVEIGDIKWSPVKYRYKHWAGLYQENDRYLYVNRGFGYMGYPGRIGMPPEITIIELHKSLI